MAKEKKPSLYVDRGTIGSHDELDEYGVWVKSEPQDMSLSSTDSNEILEDFEEFSEDVFGEASDTDSLDLEISDMEDLPNFDNSQEDDSLEFSTEDTTDIVMEDDFELPDIGEEFEETLPAVETIDFEELEDFTSQEDIGFEEAAGFDETVGLEDTAGFEEAVGLESDTGFDEIIGLEDTAGSDETIGLDDTAGFDETIGLEDTAGFDEIIGLDDTAGFDETIGLEDSAGFDEIIGLEDTAGFDEITGLDDTADSLDLPEELPLEASAADALESVQDEEFTEIVLEEMVEHQDTEPASDLPFPQELADDELTGDEYPAEQVPDVKEADGTAPLPAQTIPSDTSSMTLSTRLLMKIAEELSSIRSELSTLKKGFSSANTGPSPSAPAMEEDEKIALTGDELSTILNTEPDPLMHPPPAEEDANGFFNGEDDEKIALTGDELSDIFSTTPPAEAGEDSFIGKEEVADDDDEIIALTGDELSNILNTADFTEETGADATMEASEDIGTQETEASMDTGPEEADLEELELEYTKGELQIEEAAVPEVEIVDPAEEMEEQLAGFDMLSDSLDVSDPFELDESVELTKSFEPVEIESAELTESTEDFVEIPLEEVLEEEETLLDVSFEEEESLPDFAIEEIEELSEIQESGVEPITYAPDADDSDYLTEDPLSEDPLSLEESIDLSEAVIDEPDFSSEIQDNPIEEPSLEDISIDLDLEEDISIPESIFDESASEVEMLDQEIELSMDISEDSADSELLEDDFIPFETDDEDMDLLSSVHVSSPVSSEDGGDLSLIPEGFVVDATESDSVEFDSLETDSEELISTDFPEDSTTVEELEMELGSPELDASELDTLDTLDVLDSPEPDSGAEFDSEMELHSEAELDTMELDSDETISIDDIDDFVTETEDFSEEITEMQDDTPPSGTIPEAVSVTAKSPAEKSEEIPSHLKKELKTVLSYMDQLLESLPDEKIEEFARSEYYDTYKKLFKELGLV